MPILYQCRVATRALSASRQLMEIITAKSIREGQTFPESLFMASGQKLLNGGVTITARHLAVLRNLPDTQLYRAQSVGELVKAGIVRRVDAKSLRVGQKAMHDLYGAGGNLVLEQGETVEAHHLDAMEAGAFAGMQEEQSDAQRRRRERMMMAEASIEQLCLDCEKLDLRIPAAGADIWSMRPTFSPPPWPDADQLIHERGLHVERVRKWQSQVEAGSELRIAEVQAVVDELFALLLAHPERFTQLALLCPRRDNYLPDHALCVTVLAMAMAARLTWSAAHIKQIGVMGLLYDVGMLLVPERIRQGGCALSEIDRQRVQRHPSYSLTMLSEVPGLDRVIQLGIFQHHERETGIGYPMGLRGERICDFAKVLALADVFAAATSPRAYQQPKLPYVVMEELIRSAAAGIFHKPAARALVQAAGLFPVGSYVLLSNRLTAHVFAANAQRLDRPTLRLLDKENQPTNVMIDLAQVPAEKLSVIRPAPRPETAASLAG
jgi:HD-GYP domain-containing protein (c-di-GMP phosphodiesterase class II)